MPLIPILIIGAAAAASIFLLTAGPDRLPGGGVEIFRGVLQDTEALEAKKYLQKLGIPDVEIEIGPQEKRNVFALVERPRFEVRIGVPDGFDTPSNREALEAFISDLKDLRFAP